MWGPTSVSRADFPSPTYIHRPCWDPCPACKGLVAKKGLHFDDFCMANVKLGCIPYKNRPDRSPVEWAGRGLRNFRPAPANCRKLPSTAERCRQLPKKIPSTAENCRQLLGKKCRPSPLPSCPLHGRACQAAVNGRSKYRQLLKTAENCRAKKCRQLPNRRQLLKTAVNGRTQGTGTAGVGCNTPKQG